MKIQNARYEECWRFLNNDRLVLIEELLDILNREERRIVCCSFGLKSYRTIKRPSLRNASRILGIPRTTIRRRFINIKRKIKAELFKQYLS